MIKYLVHSRDGQRESVPRMKVMFASAGLLTLGQSKTLLPVKLTSVLRNNSARALSATSGLNTVR